MVLGTRHCQQPPRGLHSRGLSWLCRQLPLQSPRLPDGPGSPSGPLACSGKRPDAPSAPTLRAQGHSPPLNPLVISTPSPSLPPISMASASALHPSPAPLLPPPREVQPGCPRLPSSHSSVPTTWLCQGHRGLCAASWQGWSWDGLSGFWAHGSHPLPSSQPFTLERGSLGSPDFLVMVSQALGPP